MPLQLKGLDIVVAGVADTKCSVSMTGLSNSNLRDFRIEFICSFFRRFYVGIYTKSTVFLIPCLITFPCRVALN